MLPKEQFAAVIRSAPLIAMDLIVSDRDGRILLGMRINAPARGFWFVPGGRIFKDESLDDAFGRIAGSELGLKMTRQKACFLGVYEHFYDENVFDTAFSTHYVVLAYGVTVEESVTFAGNQHSAYRWIDRDAIPTDDAVHHYTKDYFIS